MSGQWPPEWDDEDDVTSADGGEQAFDDDVRLAEVAAYLASVPAPVLPAGIEAQISAAIAAESVSRAPAGRGDAVPAAPGTENGVARPLGPAPGRPRLRRRRGGAARRSGPGRQGGDGPGSGFGRRFLLIGPLLAIVVVAGLAYALTLSGSSSSSSIPASGGAQSSSSRAAAAAPEAGSAGSVPRSAAGSAVAPSPLVPGFTVTKSGTKYQKATLAGQVRTTEAALGPGESKPFATEAQTPALAGCVRKLAGGQSLRLVDRATYQGKAAYVIASSSHIWVVGTSCTAADPQLVESVSLAG